MVEVFKTSVRYQQEASEIIDRIRQCCDGFDANFDLEDCDKILRVCSMDTRIEPELIIKIVQEAGFCAEILHEDEEMLTTGLSV